MMARAARLILLGLVAAFLLVPEMFAPLLAPLAAPGGPVIYDRASLLTLTLAQLGLVLGAIIPAAGLAVGLALWVTRPGGRDFLPLSRALANAGQTFPPVAVLALAVPLLGFGARPALLALFLYGLLPIFENALAGIGSVPPATRTAAEAMGMTGGQRIWRVELPLALPLILEGLRIATVIALSTATLGSTVAAPSLGEVIIAGLNADNMAFVVQGGVLTAALAVLIYDAGGWLIRRTSRRA